MDLEQILAEGFDVAALDDEELAAALDVLVEAAAMEAANEDDLAVLRAVADAADAVRAEITRREEAAVKLAEEAAALQERIRGEQEPEPGDEPDAEEPATGDPDDAADEGADDGAEPAQAETPLPVAASLPARTTARASLGAIRRRAERMARQEAHRAVAALTAAADVPGLYSGQPVTDERMLSDALLGRWQAFGGQPSLGYQQIPVVRGRVDFPEDRMLTSDVHSNMEKIAAVLNPQALVAAGGLCAPVTPRYELANISSAARPLRDALPQFGADRGGIRFIEPPILTDVASSITVWTEANDTNPSNPATKGCLTVTCGNETTVVIEAIVKCLKFGNFSARTFPEQVATFTALAAAQHARRAEVEILNALSAGSTHVTAGTVLGTARDVLATLDRAAAQMRFRHRTTANFPLTFLYPDWLYDNIRTDLARELPGSSDERLAVAESTIDTFFRVRNLNPVSFLDGETGQTYGAQAAGGLNPWLSSVVTYLFPSDTWLFLDGGTLDLGVVRDSSLNATNDFQMFMETFEGVAMVGIESLRLSMDICPSGATAATDDTTGVCTSGS